MCPVAAIALYAKAAPPQRRPAILARVATAVTVLVLTAYLSLHHGLEGPMRWMLICALFAGACNGSGEGAAKADMGDMAGGCPNSGAPAATVTVVDDQYQPQSVTVPVCGKVRWNFQASSKHGVYPFDMNFPASPVMSQGVYEYAFPAAGTYNYGCAIHGHMMPGSVLVK